MQCIGFFYCIMMASVPKVLILYKKKKKSNKMPTDDNTVEFLDINTQTRILYKSNSFLSVSVCSLHF